jgi:hypothetical protein
MRKRGSKPKNKEGQQKMPRAKPYISEPISLNIKKLENPFHRADLEFHGVDHSSESYEGRVFINNPDANQNTSKTSTNGYVGSFHIFGHGGCYGDIGHCEIRKEKRPFDYRPPHPLTPLYKRLILTDDLLRLGKNTDKFTVTIVPILAGGSTDRDVRDIVKVDRISLITYD